MAHFVGGLFHVAGRINAGQRDGTLGDANVSMVGHPLLTADCLKRDLSDFALSPQAVHRSQARPPKARCSARRLMCRISPTRPVLALRG
jgi:hypothetical protein